MNILCLSDSTRDVDKFTKKHDLYFYPIEQMPPSSHSFDYFNQLFIDLNEQVELSTIDLIIAEYVESLPILFFIRKSGHFCPAILIPHTNPYPLDYLTYFLLISTYSHRDDIILCGSLNAVKAYEKIVRIRSMNITTFGIQSDYRIFDKQLARQNLGLSLSEKLLLYTGRIMNDKGIRQLLRSVKALKKRMPDVRLMVSTTIIDSHYYNALASDFVDVILFYRLAREQLAFLYSAADIYVSCATSIFETYGKAPLEAIVSGTPVLLPNWDGFRYYVNEGNGQLVKVNYLEEPEENPYQFATIDANDFVDKAEMLLKEPLNVNSNLPDWACYHHTLNTLEDLVENYQQSKRYFNDEKSSRFIDLDIYPLSVKKYLEALVAHSTDELIQNAVDFGIIGRRENSVQNIVKELHDDIFKTMDNVAEKIL